MGLLDRYLQQAVLLDGVPDMAVDERVPEHARRMLALSRMLREASAPQPLAGLHYVSYSEGTWIDWTPTVSGVTTPVVHYARCWEYSSGGGNVGNIASFELYISGTANGGAITITGLPIASNGDFKIWPALVQNAGTGTIGSVTLNEAGADTFGVYKDGGLTTCDAGTWQVSVQGVYVPLGS